MTPAAFTGKTESAVNASTRRITPTMAPPPNPGLASS
jgi:hypothetical protein